ncbi:Sulfur carrier protein ThiS [Corynebacterium capitovis DSM 44611]|nr:Sulfur carrier protein ThiS [Corynebacterium capitovis DSM 44611]
MKITLNDEVREVRAGSVEKLLAELDIADTGTAVAVDGEVVPRSEWATTNVAAGARVDILSAVQGG